MNRAPNVPHEDAYYTADQVADILRIEAKNAKARRNAVYRIPEYLLPRVPRSPQGRRVLFRGRDLIAYLNRNRTWTAR